MWTARSFITREYTLYFSENRIPFHFLYCSRYYSIYFGQHVPWISEFFDPLKSPCAINITGLYKVSSKRGRTRGKIFREAVINTSQISSVFFFFIPGGIARKHEYRAAPTHRACNIRYAETHRCNFRVVEPESENGKARLRKGRRSRYSELEQGPGRNRKKGRRKGIREISGSCSKPADLIEKEWNFAKPWAAVETPPSILFRSQWHSSPRLGSRSPRRLYTLCSFLQASH